MAGDDENFLSRWSRLKREEAAKPAPASDAHPVVAADPADAATQAETPQLPPVETLTLESDFRAFLQPNVAPELRRAALKKLFSDPHFHFDQMDRLDTYIDDYTKFEPISEEMLKTLDHARHILFDQEKPVADAAAEPQGKNGDPGQNT